MDYLKTGFLAIANNDFQEAVNIFRRSLEIKKSAPGYNGLGRAFRGLGDPKAAHWAFHKGLELDKNNQELLDQLSILPDKAEQASHITRLRRFRSVSQYLEVYEAGWRRLFIKGVNLGLGIPGYFPGEFPIRETTYLKWFKEIVELGANSIRLYTVHPPDFYNALTRFNNSDGTLYLFQGIWCELPKQDNFRNSVYQNKIRKNISQAIDVVHGSAELPVTPGMASGSYKSDVSSCTAAFIIGREWEPCAVKGFNASHQTEPPEFTGTCLEARDCTPFERWIVETCDYLQTYEQKRYGEARPVSVSNWPTLDPLTHHSESTVEDELAHQGITVRPGICNENEDMQSLDVSKFTSRRGGGFFATYHVYPYYPDFLNNDNPDAANPYLEYLKNLKKYHGKQPVMIAEFGVPSSREITHWQKNGWHHGGLSEKSQGEITGSQMKTIHDAGMAGGMMFSWFDEWFKRNWLFLPYELPAERNPFWFNHQDAEQNFGLLATYPGYPGKTVTLNGNNDEWKQAVMMYEKKPQQILHRFNDSHDPARTLTRLQAISDEGFLYIRLETDGPVDFRHARYLIGIDTCSPDTGERQLPLKTRCYSPIGLKFLIHLAGRSTSRILVSKTYDKYLNRDIGIRPVYSDQGAWVTMHNRTNARRISKDNKQYYPSRVAGMSMLKFGSLDTSNSAYDSLADFYYTGNAIEIRIPWGLINVTDPSSRTVLWQDSEGQTRITDGIRLIAASFKPSSDAQYAMTTGKASNCTDCLPDKLTKAKIKTFTWNTWNVPVYHTYRKAGFNIYRDLLKSIPEVS